MFAGYCHTASVYSLLTFSSLSVKENCSCCENTDYFYTRRGLRWSFQRGSVSSHSFSMSSISTQLQYVHYLYTASVCPLSLHSFSVSTISTQLQCVHYLYTASVYLYTASVCPLSVHSFSVSTISTQLQCVHYLYLSLIHI